MWTNGLLLLALLSAVPAAGSDTVEALVLDAAKTHFAQATGVAVDGLSVVLVCRRRAPDGSAEIAELAARWSRCGEVPGGRAAVVVQFESRRVVTVSVEWDAADAASQPVIDGAETANRFARALRDDLGDRDRLSLFRAGRALRLFDWLRHDGDDYSGDRAMVAVAVATGLPVAYRASWSPPQHRPFAVVRSAALDTALRHAQLALGRTDLALGGERRYLTYPGSDPPQPVYAFGFRSGDATDVVTWVWVDGLEGGVLQSADLARLIGRSSATGP